MVVCFFFFFWKNPFFGKDSASSNQTLIIFFSFPQPENKTLILIVPVPSHFQIKLCYSQNSLEMVEYLPEQRKAKQHADISSCSTTTSMGHLILMILT